MTQPQDEWEKKFDEKWDGCFSDKNGDYVNPQVKDFIRTLAQSEYQRGRMEAAIEIQTELESQLLEIPAEGKFYTVGMQPPKFDYKKTYNTAIHKSLQIVEHYTQPIE